MTLGDYAGAMATARSALELDPGRVELEREILRAYWFDGSYEKARAVGRQLLGRDSESAARWREPVAADVAALDDIVQRMQALRAPRSRLRVLFAICLGAGAVAVFVLMRSSLGGEVRNQSRR
jgi:hypothetical protein